MSTRNEVEAALIAAWTAADHLEATSPQQRLAIKSPIEVAVNSLPAPPVDAEPTEPDVPEGGAGEEPVAEADEAADAPKPRAKKGA